MIAALYVLPDGPYANRAGVDAWPEARDARNYAGPWPVVAHPPCARWRRLAGLVEARWGHKRGDDGGTFASALAAVRRFGGVIEHPAYSDAWRAFGLPRPDRRGGWYGSIAGGYSAHVEQSRYGHPAKKATWLYVFGVPADKLPALPWGSSPDRDSKALVSWCGNHVRSGEDRPRLGKKAASRSPEPFAELLLSIAALATQEAAA